MVKISLFSTFRSIPKILASILGNNSPENRCGRCENWSTCDGRFSRCGNNDEKLQICHYIPGSGGNAYETICVSEEGAQNHFRNTPPHCDHCGPCRKWCLALCSPSNVIVAHHYYSIFSFGSSSSSYQQCLPRRRRPNVRKGHNVGMCSRLRPLHGRMRRERSYSGLRGIQLG